MTKPVKTTDITSAANAHYKRWRGLTSAAGIKKEGEFLLSGRKIIAEAVGAARLQFSAVICKKSEVAKVLQEPWLKDLGVPVYTLPAELFNELDEIGAPGPLLVARVPKIPEAELTSPPQGLELLLGLQDPANVGAALRIAEAFGARVVLMRECAHPFLPKSVRASSGSVFRVPLLRGPSVKELVAPNDGGRANRSESSFARDLVTLDLDGTDIGRFQWPRDVRLFVGVEGPGVPAQLKSGPRVRIPIKAGMDSLNAVSALSIAVYSYQLQFRA